MNVNHSTSTELAAYESVPAARVPARRRLRNTLERGMVTAEYAVGILSAVALALVLYNVLHKSEFVTQVLEFVVQAIAKVGGLL